MATKKAAAPETSKEEDLNIVDMLDANGNKTGRLVEFGTKRKLLKESGVDNKGVFVLLDFSNGQSRKFYIPDAMMEKFAAHGAEQKLGDEIAGIQDVEDCVEAVDQLIDRLYNNEWAAKREANAMAGASILVKALVESSGKTVDEVRSFLAPLSHAQKVALRANAAIAPIVQRMEAEKLAKKKPGKVVDTESLLSNLALGIITPAVPTSTEGAPSAPAEAAA